MDLKVIRFEPATALLKDEVLMNAATTLEAVQAWPVDEQLDFLFRAWDQLLERGTPPVVDDELRAELRRRLAAHDADPSRVLTWEQVEAHVRRAR